MQTTTSNSNKEFIRLEDSFSNPENQKHLPEDPYVQEVEKSLVARWHKINVRRNRCESHRAANA